MGDFYIVYEGESSLFKFFLQEFRALFRAQKETLTPLEDSFG